MVDKNTADKYSQYDCELSYAGYDKQKSSYLDVENYSGSVCDEDIPIPDGFDPYSTKININ